MIKAAARVGLVSFASLAAQALGDDGQPPPRNAELAARIAALPETLTAARAREALELALAFLVAAQNPDGSWGSASIEGLWDSHYALESYYAWQYAGVALAAYGLMLSPATPERGAALERAFDWLVTTRFPKRPSDWDNDTLWAAVYGLVAVAQAADDPRFQGAAWQPRLAARGRACVDFLVANQVPGGGWGYYDDPPYTARPKWATSFSTACVVPALAGALRRGWLSDPDVVRRAVRYVARCRLPNGAYEYDLNPIPRVPAGEHINQIQGSLGRIQVCNWALREVGETSITDERLREGLRAFFDEHRYLDAARLRPIPHEAYFANAGYFYFFGHYYAALAINLLPQGEREALHARLRPHLVKALRPDGSTTDFLDAKYDVLASTAFLALALDAGMGGEDR